MKLWKANEGGSAFLIVNNTEETLAHEQLAALAAEQCAACGAQALIAVGPAVNGADCRAEAFSPAGEDFALYGDGARGLCRWAYENGICGDVQRIETPSGELNGARLGESRWRVRLGAPGKMKVRHLLSIAGRTMACAYLQAGYPARPFAVMRYGEMAQAPDEELARLGGNLSRHESFPGGADVFLYDIMDDETILGRAYSRTAQGLLPSCTAGAAGAAALLAVIGAVSWKGIRIEQPGGTLELDVDLYKDIGGGVKSVWVTGEAELETIG